MKEEGIMQRFREPVNGFTHFIGVIFGFVALAWLISKTHDTPDKMLSMIVYGICVILLYAASTTFHLVNGSDQTVQMLCRLDHAAIYLMIAGTYTPLVYNVLSGIWRWGVLGIVWTLAIIGVIYKLRYLRQDHRRLSVLLYMGMGWMGLITLPQAIQLLDSRPLQLIIAGGIVYTVGALVFMLKRPNLHRFFDHHALWHIFVLAGSALHFAVVLAVA
jgi:hemolysin III